MIHCLNSLVKVSLYIGLKIHLSAKVNSSKIPRHFNRCLTCLIICDAIFIPKFFRRNIGGQIKPLWRLYPAQVYSIAKSIRFNDNCCSILLGVAIL